MKYLLIVLFAGLSCTAEAQQLSGSQIQFNAHFYDLPNHWVAFPKNEKTGKYPFGFIYIDSNAGFTFNLEGNFETDAQGRIFRDSTDYLKKTASYKYRLAANTKPVFAIPDAMLASLNVKPVPDWVAIYKIDKNTVAGKIALGRNYNSAGQPKIALGYLESAYKAAPHTSGLEFELTYSYNELNEYNKAVEVLKSAITNKPDNALFYRELGYAYMKENDSENALKTYTKGIDMTGNDRDTKAEMAWNMAVIYHQQNNDTEYKNWGQKAKDWAPAGSDIAKRLSGIVF